MRILFANPNTTVAMTDRIAAVARAAASPGTEIVAVTGQTGVPYIATRAEAVIGARVALELLAEHAGGCDVAVIAAFADPGIGGARELLSIPVIGMAEAAMLTACMLGRRFSIVTFATAVGPWFRECVEYNGLTSRLASIRCVSGGVRDINTVQDDKQALLVEACRAAVAEDDADVIILGDWPRRFPTSCRCRWWMAWRQQCARQRCWRHCVPVRRPPAPFGHRMRSRSLGCRGHWRDYSRSADPTASATTRS
jgi:allantoin racemase